MILFLIQCVLSLEITPIPKNLTPPTVRRSISAVYNKINNSVYLFGGCKQAAETFSNIMWRFDLTENIWEHLNIKSPLIPEVRYGTSMSIFQDLIFVYGGSTHLGSSSDLWTYNLTSNSWLLIERKGEAPKELSLAAHYTFELGNTSYFAIYGGYSMEGLSNDLYLMDLSTLIWTKMPQRGDIPPLMKGIGMVFYHQSLYIWGLPESDLESNDTVLYLYNLTSLSWHYISTTGDFPEKRSSHGVALIDNYYYIFFGINYHANIDVSSTYRVNLDTGVWENVKISGPTIVRSMFGYIQVGNQVWIFCGSSLTGLYNSIYKFDFIKNELITVFNNTRVPKRRHSYSMDRIGTKLILFGGTDQEFIYNELYAFDLISEDWVLHTPLGTAPLPRYNHCSTVFKGLYLVIFGGEDLNGYFADFFIYNFNKNSWSIIKTDISIGARTGCCMTSYEEYIIVHGGKTTRASATDEILILNFYLKTLSVLSDFEKKSINVNLMNHKCWIRIENQQAYLVLANGERPDLSSSKKIYSVSLESLLNKSAKWMVLKDTDEEINWASSGIVNMGDWFIQIGGCKRALYASSLINVVFLDDVKKPLTISNTENQIYWYKHGVGHFRRRVYVGFSGAYYGNLIKKEFLISHFYRITPGDDEKIFFPCSAGTYGNDCNVCPKGTYSDTIGALECKKCPAGTYGLYEAATSIFMCFPCKFNYFNPDKGKKECIFCESTKFCPVGSSKPTNYIQFEDIIVTSPAPYASDIKDPFDGKIYYIVYFLAAAGFLIFITVPKLRITLSKLDYFSEKHNTMINQPLIKTKTALGGFFTFIFIIFAIIYTSQIINSYANDNIIETKSLVPSVTIEEIFSSSEFIISIELFYYRGECIVRDEICSKNMNTEANDVKWKKKCYKPRDDLCVVKLECNNCEIPGDLMISNKVCEFGSLASAIRVNVSSDSSIPGYISAVSFTINHIDGKVFRGSEPSIFYFEVTPSLFLSESSDWPNIQRGYHIGAKNLPEKGTSIQGDEYLIFRIDSESCVAVNIKLDKASSILVTSRLLVFSFWLIVSTVIGSIFGFLELFCISMIVMEKLEDCIGGKYQKMFLLEKMIRKRYLISLSFEQERTLRRDGTLTRKVSTKPRLGSIPNLSQITEIHSECDKSFSQSITER
ncbi:hypothetical protein SteCoe_21516 [Stentor coeruleus]|uniref:Uncharacterized protein n=1 Tax=Stentor coeruleus TaxID=5963 RepID=A0A1R2BP68_9CILI|nr:hypothetical protein SteCoe_21516 [Stentor coeruleus]